MLNLEVLGRFLLLGAVVLAITGVILLAAARLGIPFFQLPGDATAQRGNVTIFFPFVSCLVLSILLTILLNLALWLMRRFF
ncbi:MAG: DUF2905 family protein [Anaerolineae bacterium]